MKRITKPNHRKLANAENERSMKLTNLMNEVRDLKNDLVKEKLKQGGMAIALRNMQEERNTAQRKLLQFEHAIRDVHRSILRRAQLSHESSEALRNECPDLSIADGISKYNGIRSAALIKKALDTLKNEYPQQACSEEQAPPVVA